MIDVGIDYSMSSPSVCVNGTHVYFLTKNKKLQQEWNCGSLRLCGIESPSGVWASPQARFDFISDFVIESILKNTLHARIFLEGYSYGSVGKTFEISENTGVLKHKLFLEGFAENINIVAPSSLKKFATGSGRADKQMMQDAFVEQTGIADLKQHLHQTEKSWNPSSDIIDAYFLWKFGSQKK